MRKILALVLPPVLMAPLLAPALGCKAKGSKAPTWIQAAPGKSAMAFSVSAGWVLDHENVQSLVARYPLADQMLDLFLKKAHVNPHDEPGRVTFYALDLPNQAAVKDPKELSGSFLILLDGFKDPTALQAAVLESFPQEGSMTLDGKEAALHVIMDLNQVHLRAAVGADGRIWLGDLSALGRRAAQGPLTRKAAVQAAEWIDAKATFQGMVQAEPLLAAVRGQVPKDLGLDIPMGVDTLAWSVTPATDPKAPHRLELALTGTPESISQVTPWLQRIGALASTMGPNAAPPPDIVTERTRAGLRASLTQDQLNAVLGRLGVQPLHIGARGPRT